MKRFLAAVTVLVAALLFAAPASARNRAYGFCEEGATVVVSSGIQGVPDVQASYPACTVTVYLTGTLTPATLFSDNSGTPLANPFTASSSTGYWFFYADDGRYDVVLSGAGFPSPFTFADVSLNSGSGGSVKPSTTDGIVFVTREGSDTNDCLSWGSACLTLLGGYNKLGGDGGTIYVTSGLQSGGPACTPVSNQGLGIAGPSDPNYASMPGTFGGSPGVYWVKAKSGFSGISIVGVSANASGQNATTGAGTPISCANNTGPAFQFSYTQGVTLSNLVMAYPAQGILVNVDSNGDATGSLGAGSNINFENLQINICNSCGAGPGPNIWIGGNFLWIKMTNLALQGNANNTTVDGRAAILVKTGGGGMAPASGLIHMEHINTTGGGNFVMEPDWNIGTGGFDIDDWTMEGSATATPVVFVGDGGAIFGADIRRLVMSDAASAPWVHIPSTTSPFFVHVYSPLGQDLVTLDGPMDIIGEMRVGGINGVAKVGQAAVPSIAPQAFHEVGYPLGRLAGIQTDVERRIFEGFARFTNLAPGDPTTWTPTTGDSSITTGQIGPDGVADAAKVSSTVSSQGEGAVVYNATINWQPGDYSYIGVWARAASTNGVTAGAIVSSELCLCFPFGSGPQTKLVAGSYGANGGSVLGASASPQTDGEWQYLWAVGKAVSGFGNAGTRLEVHATTSTKPMYYANPVFARIPASTFALVAAPTFASGSESGSIVTMSTAAPHGLSPSEPILVSGCTPSGYNGEVTIISDPTTSSFTYFSTTAGMGAASGCVITPGSDSEAADWGMNAAAWSDGAPLSTLATLRGVPMATGGTDAFWATLTHTSLTANRSFNFPDASGNVSLSRFYDCGTAAACTPTEHLTPRVVIGDAQLNGANPSLVTITGMSPAFTSNVTFHCVASDETATTHYDNKITYVSGSSFTITSGQNGLTDVLHYICVGY